VTRLAFVLLLLTGCAPWRVGPFTDPHAAWCASDTDCRNDTVCRFPSAYGPHGEAVHAVCVPDPGGQDIANGGYPEAPQQ
jgi:hypothetical protein